MRVFNDKAYSVNSLSNGHVMKKLSFVLLVTLGLTCASSAFAAKPDVPAPKNTVVKEGDTTSSRCKTPSSKYKKECAQATTQSRR